MIFLSDFLSAEVVDLRQHRIGRVRDLVVLMTDPFPKVTGVVLKGNRRIRSVDWSVVRSWDNKELSLKVEEANLHPNCGCHDRCSTSKSLTWTAGGWCA
jgi:sporulation protein YlmC with PRC-barrel domain